MSHSDPTPPSAAGSRQRRRHYRLRRRAYQGLPPEPPTPTAAKPPAAEPDHSVRSLKADLQTLREELSAAQEGQKQAEEALLRARADLENQRRRHQREKEEARKFAEESMARDLLIPMDHFGLALQSMVGAASLDALKQGVEMIHRELAGVLESHGVQEVRPDGAQFDPELHEAGATEHDPKKPEGVVLATLRSGWSLRGRVLRPALVKVNKAGAPVEPQ